MTRPAYVCLTCGRAYRAALATGHLCVAVGGGAIEVSGSGYARKPSRPAGVSLAERASWDALRARWADLEAVDR